MLPDQIRKAEIAMMKVGIRALQLGAFVSKPIFEGARYDYIIERDGKLYRAQVKYAVSRIYRSGSRRVKTDRSKVAWQLKITCGNLLPLFDNSNKSERE